MRHRLIKSETYLVSKKKNQTNKTDTIHVPERRQIIVILEIPALYT